MTTKKDPAMRKAPVVSIEEMQEVNGNLIGGKLTAENGKIFKLYAYTFTHLQIAEKAKLSRCPSLSGMETNTR